MSAILFGSISTVIDTSELQRQAFNRAFQAHGLDWSWGREEYVDLLERSGGQDRIAEYAAERGEEVDAAAVHATKSTMFQESLAASPQTLRPGVAETVRAAHDHGQKVALVTTTSPENVASLIEALGSELSASDFDLVVDSSDVEAGKPDPAAYVFALDQLGESGTDCVAIEDNVDGVRAAAAAGVTCVAFPNENTSGHAFGEADHVVDRIGLDDLNTAIQGA